jgi:two-component system cell cycle sensor histidine kinase/response regulator CckA
MSIPIEVLILEDNPTDAELMIHELLRSGFDPSWRRLETESEYIAHLASPADVILADYHMPQMDAALALQLLQERGLDIPFIVVSGAIGEEVAVAMMRQGAADYLLKDRLMRLGPAVRRALNERRLRAEKRRAEEELRKSTEEIYDLYNHAPCGYHSLDGEDVFARVNDTELAWLGYSREELVGKVKFTALVAAENLEEVENALKRLRSQRAIRDLECGLVCRNGAVLPVLLSATAVRDGDGNYLMSRMTVHDITERRRAETAIRQHEALLRSVLESLPVGVWVIDTAGRVVIANRAGQAIRDGVSFSSLEGRGEEQPGGPDAGTTIELLARAAGRVLAQGETFVNELIEVECADKTRKILSNSSVPLYDAGGKIAGAIVVAEDITERRKMEERLQQSQKMEAVGQLAGGVAHDFNNLLTVISGYASLLAEVARGGPSEDYANEIVTAAARAADLTTRLLAFSRRQVIRPRVLDLNATIRNAENMLRRLIGEGIELETVLAADLDRIVADPIHIEQILLNLGSNARDAMSQGGKLTIHTANFFVAEGASPPGVDLPPGSYVMLRVTDTGCGMDRAIQARIFEPFFTTKPQNIGTGLGLATVHSIVMQNRGRICVWSAPGEGASFTIYLPATAEAEAVPAPAPARAARRAHETILLVEDESSIRRLVARLLQRAGYKVLKAAHAQEALDLCRRYEAKIHLLLTDVLMPGMTGLELARKIRALRPGVKILYMSGCADNWIQEYGALPPDVNLLPKPILPAALLKQVREALRAGRNDASSA